MEVIIAENYNELIAEQFVRQIQGKSHSTLGLATGATPMGVYQELCRRHQDGDVDFAQVTTFNLDEYVGLSPEHPASYRHYMNENLFSHINIEDDHTHVPNGLADDIPAECQQYEEKITRSGGVDLQLLGIGGDGHIGFNEPSSSLSSRTRIKTLTQRTLNDNAKYFDGVEVPKHVITMGIGTIMESERIILLATGAKKAAAVAQMIEGPISAMCPASILQMHPHVQVYLDDSSAGELRRREYYQWVFEQKPSWQR